MKIIVNGQEKEVNNNTTLKSIISELQIEDKVMASAVNMKIVKKEDWDNYIVKDDDKLELLEFVGGG
jgi:sulfur carrier protein